MNQTLGGQATEELKVKPSSSEERVDVIDEQNNVIKTVPKSLAHQEGLLHRIAIGQLVNSKGKYCFVRQSNGRQDAGQFVSPIGGHVSAGETTDQAIIRESVEEVSITPTDYKLIGQTIFSREVIGRKENHLFFIYEIKTDQDPVLNHESVEFKWFTTDEIKKALVSHNELFGAAWHHAFNFLANDQLQRIY